MKGEGITKEDIIKYVNRAISEYDYTVTANPLNKVIDPLESAQRNLVVAKTMAWGVEGLSEEEREKVRKSLEIADAEVQECLHFLRGGNFEQ